MRPTIAAGMAQAQGQGAKQLLDNLDAFDWQLVGLGLLTNVVEPCKGPEVSALATLVLDNPDCPFEHPETVLEYLSRVFTETRSFTQLMGLDTLTQKQLEDTMLCGHTAVLLACFARSDTKCRAAIQAALPSNSLADLVEVLSNFADFQGASGLLTKESEESVSQLLSDLRKLLILEPTRVPSKW
jgi:hypothetical protein